MGTIKVAHVTDASALISSSTLTPRPEITHGALSVKSQRILAVTSDNSLQTVAEMVRWELRQVQTELQPKSKKWGHKSFTTNRIISKRCRLLWRRYAESCDMLAYQKKISKHKKKKRSWVKNHLVSVRFVTSKKIIPGCCRDDTDKNDKWQIKTEMLIKG